MGVKVPETRLVQHGNTLFQVILRSTQTLILEKLEQEQVANAVCVFAASSDKDAPITVLTTKGMQLKCHFDRCKLDEKYKFMR